MAVWAIVIMMIFPEMKDKMMEMQTAKLEAQGLSEEQIQQGMNMTKKFTTPPMILLFTLLGMTFFGTILSLVAAAIAKKNPQPQQMQQS